MKLSLSTIITRFLISHPENGFANMHATTPINGVRLLPETTKGLDPSYLYVTELIGDNNIPDASALPTAYFCATADSIKVSGYSILIPFKGGLARGFNEFIGIYNDFREWERKLNTVILKDGSVQDAIDVCAEMIKSPVLLYDPALKLLAHTKGMDDFNDTLFQNALKNGYLDLASVQYFEKVHDFEQLKKSGFAIRSTDTVREHSDYIRVINVDGEPVAHAVLLFSDIQPHDYEQSVFELFCEYLQHIFENQRANFLRDRSVADYFLMDLLDNPDTPMDQIRDRIYYTDIDYEGCYCLIIIDSDIRRKSMEHFFLSYLRNTLVGCCVFPYKESILVLYNLPTSEIRTYKDYLNEQLVRFYKDFPRDDIKIYISRPFREIGDFYASYRQASNTRALISKNKSLAIENESKIYYFKDYWIYDLMSQNTIKEKLVFYCEPCILELMNTDSKKSRHQLEILYNYLINDRNATEVSKKLNMHRNNVVYHINNFEEKYSIDLNDPDSRLKLLLSFKLANLRFD